MAALDHKTVIEDVRSRHTAVVGLLYATDTQALSLLRLYVILGIATASGAAAGLGQSSTLVPKPAAWALAAATIVILIGASFCLKALGSVRVNLPGRNPDFWDWALRDDVKPDDALRYYLDNLKVKGAANDALNKRSAGALNWAKRCGALAPLMALLVGVGAVAFRV